MTNEMLEKRPKLYSVEEAYTELGITRQTFYEWLHRIGEQTDLYEGFKQAFVGEDILDRIREARVNPGITKRRARTKKNRRPQEAPDHAAFFSPSMAIPITERAGD